MTLLLRDVRIPGRDDRVTLRLESGRIAAVESVGELPQEDGAETLDVSGHIVLPAFVDGHVHLDKTFLGCSWQPHRPGDDIADRIAAERTQRAGLPVPLADRAALLIDRMLGFGTVAMRCHVDIDPNIGLAHLETLLDLRVRYRDRMVMQFVAFPQSGIGGPVAGLLDAALRAGAEVIGGLDPGGIDGAIEPHLDTVFGLAETHGARVDIHLHDPGTLGTFELRAIAARSQALGMQGRVAVSHAFALGQVDDREFGRTVAALAEAGVAIMTNGPGAATIPPVARLREAGVLVFAGSDNIRDAWSPYGDGDMLNRASLIGYRADLRSDAGLAQALDLVTSAPRAVLGLAPLRVEPGAVADLVVVPAETIAEAVATRPARRIVIRNGQVMPAVSGAHSGRSAAETRNRDPSAEAGEPRFRVPLRGPGMRVFGDGS